MLGSLPIGNTGHATLRRRYMTVLTMYLMALRPWSFSISLTPVALGAVLSWRETSEFSFLTLLLSAIVVVSVHAVGNLVHTYHDNLKRTTNDQIITSKGIVQLSALLYLTACLGLLAVKYSSPAKIEHLAFLFFGGLSGSFLYSGGGGVKSHPFGDLIIMVTFGPIAVLFSYVAQCAQFSFKPLLHAVPLALNAEAILHSENARDLERDKGDGVVTAATLLGPRGSYVFYLFLIFTPYIIFSVMFIKCSYGFIFPLITLRAAFDLEKCFRERNMGTVPSRTAKLNAYLGIMYVLVTL